MKVNEGQLKKISSAKCGYVYISSFWLRYSQAHVIISLFKNESSNLKKVQSKKKST
jgi:hypothetical protein